MSQDTPTRDRTFTLSREFAAPRELVFAAFSECRHLQHWWAPAGWSLPVCEMDFRAGGAWFYCMRGAGPDGKEQRSCGKAVYEEIEAPARIVYTDTFVDAEGDRIADTPAMHITVTFEERSGATLVTSETVFESEDDLQRVLDMGMEQGVAETWDKLEAHLAEIR